MAIAHMRKGSPQTGVGGLKQSKLAKGKVVAKELAKPGEAADGLRERAGRMAAKLARLYPNARISLDFTTPWQCLAATILSAQCTDERVNRTTPELFERLPDSAAMAAAPAELVEKLIMPTGFYRQKTKSLQGAAQENNRTIRR